MSQTFFADQEILIISDVNVNNMVGHEGFEFTMINSAFGIEEFLTIATIFHGKRRL